VRLRKAQVSVEWWMWTGFYKDKRCIDISPYPRPDCHFIIDSDASNKAVGVVLSQVQEGKKKL
jgi:hypothetical protein